MDIYPITVKAGKGLFVTLESDEDVIRHANSILKTQYKFKRLIPELKNLLVKTSYNKLEFANLFIYRNNSGPNGGPGGGRELYKFRGYTPEEAETEVLSKRPNLYESRYYIKLGFSPDEAEQKIKELKAKNITPRNAVYFTRQGYSEEEAKQKVSEFQSLGGQGLAKRLRERPADDMFETQIGYWKKLGYSDEDAKIKLTERQTTFSLEKLIKKHGEIKAKELWELRQTKWQNTLNSKSSEEKAIINTKKGISKSGHPHSISRFNDDEPGFLYYLRFFNDEGLDFYKIGISKYEPSSRFWPEGTKGVCGLTFKTLYIKKFDKISEAFAIEQQILHENKDNRISVKVKRFKTSEAFNVDISDQLVNV